MKKNSRRRGKVSKRENENGEIKDGTRREKGERKERKSKGERR